MSPARCRAQPEAPSEAHPEICPAGLQIQAAPHEQSGPAPLDRSTWTSTVRCGSRRSAAGRPRRTLLPTSTLRIECCHTRACPAHRVYTRSPVRTAAACPRSATYRRARARPRARDGTRRMKDDSLDAGIDLHARLSFSRLRNVIARHGQPAKRRKAGLRGPAFHLQVAPPLCGPDQLVDLFPGNPARDLAHLPEHPQVLTLGPAANGTNALPGPERPPDCG
jgi:hypothetical protein